MRDLVYVAYKIVEIKRTTGQRWKRRRYCYAGGELNVPNARPCSRYRIDPFCSSRRCGRRWAAALIYKVTEVTRADFVADRWRAVP